MLTKKSHIPKSALQPGDCYAGFTITRIRPVKSCRSLAIEARHNYTGAELLFLYSHDEENLFSVAFRTPPPDNTGVAHILEHSVLGGSKKYPVKEPFVEMLKMSMATFINAMTYPDKTVYPVASNVKQDFFNLVDVYCDAVLHPNINPTTLKQEGHHFALTQPGNLDSPLTIKGIVYNEMKGAYSDLDSLIARTSSQFLFPDTPYGLDSGGCPDEIPSLSYSEFKQFYDRFYHPANGKFFVHANIEPEKILAFLDTRLREAVPPPDVIDSTIPRQPRWDTPRTAVVQYPIADDETPEGKATVTLNWLTGDITEPLTDLALEVVDRLLLGYSAAPLRKALIDSQLGQDLTASGYDNGRLETTFHIGLKGMLLESQDEFVQIVMDTLQSIVKQGFAPAAIDRAFHQFEYSHREIQSHYPLRLMDQAYSAWLYDFDPLTYMKTDELLATLRAHYDSNPDCFLKLIQERLIDNPHRVTVVLQPEPGLQVKREKLLAEKLDKMRHKMDIATLQNIDREAQALEQLQSQPNLPENIATLPQLKIDDIPRKPRGIPVNLDNWHGTPPIIMPKLATNEINYLLLTFDLEGLPEHLWDYIPLFTMILTRMGTERYSYVEMSERIAENTGGLSVKVNIGTSALSLEKPLANISIGAKTLDHTLQPTLDIITELLFELELDDHRHFYDLIKQARERMISQIIPAGHVFVATHAARSLSLVSSMDEQLHGLPQLRIINQLSKTFEQEADKLKDKLLQIRNFILDGNRLRASFTGPAKQQKQFNYGLQSMMKRQGIPMQTGNGGKWPSPISVESGLNEGLAIQADVAYCASVMPAPHTSDPRSPILQVLAHLLAFDYMWEEIRVKGGAYGGMCHYNPEQGTFSLLSYRDPHIARTLNIYKGLLDYIRSHTWSLEDVQRAVIGCAKSYEKPVRPGWATSAAIWRQLAGWTDEKREESWQRLLQVTPDKVKAIAIEVIEENFQYANTCVLSSREKLLAETSALGIPFDIHSVIENA